MATSQPQPPDRPHRAIRGFFAFHKSRAGASGGVVPGAPVHPRRRLGNGIALGFGFAVLGFFLVAVVRALAG